MASFSAYVTHSKTDEKILIKPRYYLYKLLLFAEQNRFITAPSVKPGSVISEPNESCTVGEHISRTK